MFRKILAILILAFFCNVNAIDFDSAKESSCFDIKETVPVDLAWLLSNKLWFYPLMSRRDLYQTSVDITGKDPKDISEDEVYYKSCISKTMEGNKFIVEGFGGKRLYAFPIPKKGLSDIQFEISTEPKGPKKKGARCYTTLTDNKTFTFHACCMPDDQMTWSVSSSVKRLSEETTKLIYDHAESLGFNSDHFTGFRYNSCEADSKGEQEPVIIKNEL